MSIEVSTRKFGPFEPLIELASGGMAKIFVARRTGVAGFERLVVIKRVHPHLLEDPAFREMFRDEARVAALIHHPNVVPVLEVGEEGGELFLVLDYVESLSLVSLIRSAKHRGATLPLPIVSRIVCDVLAGLQAAHDATDMRGEPLGLIHRDVSPHNVIVGVDGTSRLIDFGIAKAAAKITSTDSKVLKGKLRYMSPEQIKKKSLDRRSDIFSAGTMLFEAITGRLLFDGENDAEVLMSILLEDDSFASAVDVPKEIVPVLDKALRQDREQRFQTALEFHEALESACPPATARDVAKWLLQHSANALSARRERIQASLSLKDSDATSQTIVDIPGAKARSRVSALARIAGIAFVVVAGGGLAYGLGARRAPSIETFSTHPVDSTGVLGVATSEPALVTKGSAELVWTIDASVPIPTISATSRERPVPRNSSKSELRRNPYQ